MLVLRVEHPKLKRGPGRAVWHLPHGYQVWCALNEAWNRFPAAGVLKSNSDHLFGVKCMDSLYAWFPTDALEILHNAGFKLAVYDAQTVDEYEHQVTFDPQTATHVGYMEIAYANTDKTQVRLHYCA